MLEVWIAALKARLQQTSRTSDRPHSSDPPDAKWPASSGAKRTPGARAGHTGHRQALLAPTEVIKVRPDPCPYGQTECLDTAPYYIHQVIELPEVQMVVKPFVLHEACCPLCGRPIKAHLPPGAQAGFGPRLTARIWELSGSQRSRRSAVQECCRSMLGVPTSQGAIQHALDRVSEALTPHDTAIAEQARRARVRYNDETG
jgi:transposase